MGAECDERSVGMKLKTKYAAGMRDELAGLLDCLEIELVG